MHMVLGQKCIRIFTILVQYGFKEKTADRLFLQYWVSVLLLNYLKLLAYLYETKHVIISDILIITFIVEKIVGYYYISGAFLGLQNGGGYAKNNEKL